MPVPSPVAPVAGRPTARARTPLGRPGAARAASLGRAAALLLTAALHASPAHAAEPLTIAVSATPLSLPLYVAQARGYFGAERLDVRLVECLSGVNCVRDLAEGRADLATASEMPIVMSRFDGSDLVVLATLATTGSNLKIVSRERVAELARPADWDGKRIGTVTGSAAHYFLDLHLLAIDVDPRRVTITGMGAAQLTGALRAGTVDAIAVWEPYPYLAVRGPDPIGFVLPRATAYVQTFNLIARRDPARDALHARLLRAVDAAERFIQDRPADAQAILRDRMRVDAGFVAWFWPSTSYRLGLDQALVRTMESEARWVLREGHVKSRPMPNFLHALNAVPLATAKPAAVSLLR